MSSPLGSARRSLRAGLGLLLLLALVAAALACGPPPAQGGRADSPPAAKTAEPPAPARGGAQTLRIADLPPEALPVLDSIRRGPPYRGAKDGTEFYNREGRLPERPRGFYREFTVPTPGRRDRGPRRIIAGRDGICYYTEDHYATFKEILP